MLSFKKLLSVISVVIFAMFILMLTTSYAWYAFENGSTTFDVATNNDNVIVSFQRGEYINTSVAVPISSNQIDKYSEKNNFTVRVKDNPVGNEMILTVSLVDIVIDKSLQNVNFKIDLYHQNRSVANISGNEVGINEEVSKTLGTVVLDDNIDNNFEVRVYILDNGEEQSALMNKTFQAKIQIEAVSRLKTTTTNYENADIQISSIVIDGEASDSLPVKGYYNMTYSCIKGSNLSWDSFNKTLIYNKKSYINDECSLNFTSSTDYSLLNKMKVGSYVKYVGTNGCDGKSCGGQNANYVNDSDMGYCNSKDNKFIANGWRIAYIESDTAYLISAGSPECVCTNKNGVISNDSCDNYESSDNISVHLRNLDNRALNYCNEKFAYGDICNNNSAWSMNNKDFKNITNSVLSVSSCNNTYGSKICGYGNDLIDNGGYYWNIISDEDANQVFGWSPYYRVMNENVISSLNGLRPVLRLKSTVVVTGGTGNYDDPYIIDVK